MTGVDNFVIFYSFRKIMCSETKQKFVRDIIAVVFVSAEENNCKLRNCRWKFQETAMSSLQLVKFEEFSSCLRHTQPCMALKSVIFAAAINPYACFYIFLIWLILIYPCPLESIPQNWFLASINSVTKVDSVTVQWQKGDLNPDVLWSRILMERCFHYTGKGHRYVFNPGWHCMMNPWQFHL
jgi:hypothetical protein